jgi:cell division septum initiation protein DivIVA
MDEVVEALPRADGDVEAQMEALRDFVVRGGPTPLNHRLWLDLEEFETRIDEIVQMFPREVRRARRITKEEQRIIQDARDEARRQLEEARAEAGSILAAARDEADRLVEASAVRQRAIEQSEAILARAQESAQEIRDRSYAYGLQVMDSVLGSIRRLNDSVSQDRIQLEQMRPGSEQP